MYNLIEWYGTNTGGGSYKFWRIRLDTYETPDGEVDPPKMVGSARLIVEWGRIGTVGQSRTYEYPTVAEAWLNYKDRVIDKTRHGYKEAYRSWHGIVTYTGSTASQPSLPPSTPQITAPATPSLRGPAALPSKVPAPKPVFSGIGTRQLILEDN